MGNATIKGALLLLNPRSFPLIFLGVEILLVLLLHSFTGVLILGIERAYPLDGGIDVLDELHLEVEESGLLDLLVDEVYLLVQELDFLRELHGTVIVHFGIAGINKIG